MWQPKFNDKHHICEVWDFHSRKTLRPTVWGMTACSECNAFIQQQDACWEVCYERSSRPIRGRSEIQQKPKLHLRYVFMRPKQAWQTALGAAKASTYSTGGSTHGQLTSCFSFTYRYPWNHSDWPIPTFCNPKPWQGKLHIIFVSFITLHLTLRTRKQLFVRLWRIWAFEGRCWCKIF